MIYLFRLNLRCPKDYLCKNQLHLNDMDAPKAKGDQMSIEISSEIAEGKYSNAVLIHQSKTEIVLDFVNTCPVPGHPRARVASRVILNPIHAKKLAYILQDSIRNYEKQFGDLEGDFSSDQEIIFTGPVAKA